ncbi:MAG: DUF3293 domain-containing protein [Pseudomonadota bacterium]|jgi:hypothetical protein
MAPVIPDPRHLPDDRLLAAYRATRYRVSAPGRDLLLAVDRYDEQLAKLLREAWVDSAALITAWNPRSQQQETERNRALQDQLVRELQAAGHPCLPGRNEAPIDDPEDWNEDSVLALDISLEEARAIAARYGQHAFLWIDKEATPRLVLTAA